MRFDTVPTHSTVLSLKQVAVLKDDPLFRLDRMQLSAEDPFVLAGVILGQSELDLADLAVLGCVHAHVAQVVDAGLVGIVCYYG